MKLDWQTFQIQVDRQNGSVDGDFVHLEERYVYVINTSAELPIGYPNGVSHVSYIGSSGRAKEKKSRLASHARGWIFRLLALSPDLSPFQISYAKVRRQNFPLAYRDVEAYLMREFHEKFGSTPFFNKRNEKELGDYEVDLNIASLFRKSSKKAVVPCFNVAPENTMEE